MTEINQEAMDILKALQSNVKLSYNYILNDEEPGVHISDGLRLARMASLMADIQAQLVDFERLTGVNLEQ